MIDKKDIELLNRITTVGAQNAALVLTKMLGTPIEVDFPDVEVISVEEILNTAPDRDKLYGFVFCKFSGDVDGVAALLLPESSVLTALEAFYGRKLDSIRSMNDTDFSGVKEVGNILIGSFLNALSNAYNITALPTVPDVAVDELAIILEDFSLILMAEEKSELVAFKTRLVPQHREGAIFGTLLILFEPEQSIKGVFQKK